MKAKLLTLLGVFTLVGFAACSSHSDIPKSNPESDTELRPEVPEDFKIVALYGPGFSDWLSWKYIITADGNVAQEIGPGRFTNKRSEKQTKLSKDDIAILFTKVKEADFFKLKARYVANVTDNEDLVLEVTMNKKTYQVSVYGYEFLKEKEDQAAVDRFLSIWSAVIRKVPAPNPKQTPDEYQRGKKHKTD